MSNPSEASVAAAAKVIADSPLIDAPKLRPECWHGLARQILEASSLTPPGRDEVIEMCAKVCDDGVKLYERALTEWNNRKNTGNGDEGLPERMQARISTARALAEDIRALKSHPASSGRPQNINVQSADK